jgi:hypothetical protein
VARLTTVLDGNGQQRRGTFILPVADPSTAQLGECRIDLVELLFSKRLMQIILCVYKRIRDYTLGAERRNKTTSDERLSGAFCVQVLTFLQF